MSQELTQQWLAEIQTLRQQLAQLQGTSDGGWESAEKWRQLYNTEAEQRRTDAQMFQVALAEFKAEIQKLKGIEDTTTLPDTSTATAIQQEIAQLQSIEELQAKLIVVMKERDRLLIALKTEQDNHALSRNSLTTALGDAIDSLTLERAAGEGESGRGGDGGRGG